MKPQDEFLNILCETVEEHCSLDHEISLKELNAAGGLYAEFGEGFAESKYYNKSTVKIMPVLFLCSDKDQERCIEQLSDICKYLQMLKSYPNGETFRWMDADVAKEPNKIGRDEGGVYHYSCIINCMLYY